MKFKTESIEDVLVIRLPADALDAANALEFKTDISALLETSKKVALDMNRVKFMDSSGVGAMLSCLRTLHTGNGELKLFNVKDQLVQLFKLVRLDRIIDIHESKKAALRAFQDQTGG
ncbi:MAG: STAS domain-containing protein [Desulfobacteraceae bacterium]|nr:STAS domain-containing protein [Desulfobacteraceae bacterium]